MVPVAPACALLLGLALAPAGLAHGQSGDDGGAAPKTVETPFVFRDVPAEESGVDVAHHAGAVGTAKRFMLECVGAGAGLVDVDDDGDLDLYLPQGGEVSAEGEVSTGAASRDALLLNDGLGRFRALGADATELSAGFGSGVTAADVDGDGDADLLVTNLGLDDLLVNTGGGRFVRAEGGAGLAGDPGDWGMGAAFADADADGDLDVYVANYNVHDTSHPMLSGQPCQWLGCDVPCGPAGIPARADRFHLNDGRGGFTDATAGSAFAAVEARYAFQPVFTDADGDGDMDLFVANDSVANSFFENQGPDPSGAPRFAERGLLTGLALSDTGKAQAGMGVAVGDVDADGRLDIVMTNFAREQNALFVNASDARFGPLFFDEASPSGLGRASYFDLGWGANLFDADLDGDLDLFVANGHVYPHVDDCDISQTRYAQHDRLYEQVEPGRFEVLDAAGGGLAAELPSRGSAAGDLDGDGDLDLVVTVLDGVPRVLRNETPRQGRWLLLDLRPRHAAVGARVELVHGDRRQVAEVRRGSSFLSTEDRRLHFGLTGDEAADVRVRWPDGRVETFDDVGRDRVVVLERGSGR